MNVLTQARDLRRRKARERHGLFVAEGLGPVEELVASGFEIRGALCTPHATASPRGAPILAALRERNIAVEEVDDRQFASAAETDTPQGILALAPVPERGLADVAPSASLRVLVLDAVQDPGNVGTMIRTAAALGASATFALPGTVDLWNAKVVRSAMGAHFHHLCTSGTWDELDAFRRERDIPVWGPDAAGTPLDRLNGARPPRLALVVGNEGAGLTPAVRAGADQLVALAMTSAAESLNVAVAAGILLYQLRS